VYASSGISTEMTAIHVQNVNQNDLIQRQLKKSGSVIVAHFHFHRFAAREQ
jgi:hypothetical protein